MHNGTSMNKIRLFLLSLLCGLAWPSAADDLVSEEESQRYFFSLMQKGQSFRVHPGTAARYLRGVWRLDRRAHVGAGHYARAERGDDVILFCNDERLLQIDFNRNDEKFIEFTGQLSELTGGEDGSLNFGNKKRQIMPLDQNPLAVVMYDYIVVLERISGAPDHAPQTAYPVD